MEVTLTMKCPRCGYFDPYWMSRKHDRYGEFAHLSDIPEAQSWPKGVVIEKDGMAYRRSDKYVNRVPLEIFKVQGKAGGKGYWDAGNFGKSHKRRGDAMTESLITR